LVQQQLHLALQLTTIVGLSKLTSDAFMVKNSSSNEIDIAIMNIMSAW
jgi:hypothetical protein